ncbi:MAG: hypothetical protein HY319_08665 [Armatimonadetes bacterium]|nr:hypothetical protein [Armatimonadota bacterium]
MKRLLIFLLLLGWSAEAQETPQHVVDISGVWRSSSGARIEIPDANYGPGNHFSIVARVGGRKLDYEAVWEGGFRQKFLYRTADGDQIIGIVLPDGNEVALVNSRQSWKASWRRIHLQR